MSVRKTARFLSLNRSSEMVWDSRSHEAGATSNDSSEDKGSFEGKSRLTHLQLDRHTTRCHVSSSSFSSNSSEEEVIFQSGPGQQVQTPLTSQSSQPSGPHRSVVHAF